MENRIIRQSLIWGLFAIILIAGSCSPASEYVVEPNRFSELMTQDSVLIVDVRTPGEYQAGRIEGAINIDFFDKDFTSKLEKLSKENKLLLYCKSGPRSGKAAKILAASGFGPIYDLKGGMIAWYAANMPVQLSSSGKRL